MNYKQCPFCQQHNCIRKGTQQGIQRWLCKDCNKKFQSQRKNLPAKEEIFCKFVFGKHTLSELSEEYHIRTKNLQQIFDEIILPEKIHNPRKISLCIDASYFGKLCTTLLRDQKNKEDLWWCFSEQERLYLYKQGIYELQEKRYEIVSITADGFPGIPRLYKDIPFQYCHFHAKKTVTTYTTRRPKTQAGIELVHIMDSLKSFNQTTFLAELTSWEKRHKSFLKEESFNPFTGKAWPTHRRILQALESMRRMSAYLFTYQKYPHLHIPTTTNTIEGHWKNIEVRMNCHNGLSLSRKMKFITAIFLNSTVTYTKSLCERLFDDFRS